MHYTHISDHVSGNNATEIYNSILSSMVDRVRQGINVSAGSRDGDIIDEWIGTTLYLEEATNFVVASKYRNMSIAYANGELYWYLKKTNSVNDFPQGLQAAKAKWYSIAHMSSYQKPNAYGVYDDCESAIINSNYGHKIHKFYGFDQFQYVLETLRKNPESRQAIIHIKDPVDYTRHPDKDVPCTLTIQYLLRDNKLNSITTMRSNDIWNGLPYDLYTFGHYQVKLAGALGVNVGSMVHNVGSLHFYKRDWDSLAAVVGGEEKLMKTGLKIWE